jgi:hypothetical protein
MAGTIGQKARDFADSEAHVVVQWSRANMISWNSTPPEAGSAQPSALRLLTHA